MDLTTELEKKVYANVDNLVGTSDTLLNTAVKATLLADELTEETLEYIVAKLRKDNHTMHACVMNELHFDMCGNDLRDDINGFFEKKAHSAKKGGIVKEPLVPDFITATIIDDVEASGGVESVLQQSEGGEA